MALFAKFQRRNTFAFDRLMETARMVRAENPASLRALAGLLLRPMQSEHLIEVAERETHAVGDGVCLETLFHPQLLTDMAYSGTLDTKIDEATPYCLDLAKDIVFSTPWAKNRFSNTLGFIGNAPGQQAWRQDSNHRVTLVLPWYIGFVDGGNHSICAGIATGQGRLEPHRVLDLEPLIKVSACDGRYYYRQDSRRRFPVTSHRAAAVFEIGRMLIDGQEAH